MVKFQTRVLVAVFVLVDVISTNLAWIAAYFLRFHSEQFSSWVPVTKGVPDLSRYLLLLPLISLLWPAVLYFHGLYKVKRGRSTIDEFFAILFSVLIASALTLGFTLYLRVYHFYEPEVAPLWEYSQAVFGLFIVLDIAALNVGRWGLRSYLKRMWAAGYNVKRVLVAGAGELGRQVAETITAHRELGYRLAGFVDDDPQRAAGSGLSVLGSLEQTTQVAAAYGVDQLYIALPLDEHAKLLRLIKSVSNECLDIKVVPDLVQYATIKAALEDIDGIPIISLNEVPLRGWNSMLKRGMDVLVASLALIGLTVIPLFSLIALLIVLRGGKGPILLRQERMTLDGKTFEIYKFRTMVDEAEKETGPVWASPEDPRRTPIGAWLRRYNLDEL